MQDRRRWLGLAIGLGTLWLAPEGASAGSVRVAIVDGEGAPVPEVAVYARALGPGTQGPERVKTPSVTINQRDLAFDPHFSIIQTGASIRFPNEDEVRHHVYSFSEAKRFNVTVDSGSVYEEPLVFDSPGVVTLGCNIHDNMLAYVLIVDTPYFSMTGGDGVAELDLEPGHYEIAIWTPRLPAKSVPEPRAVEIATSGVVEMSHRLEGRLYPAHRHSETSLLWDQY